MTLINFQEKDKCKSKNGKSYQNKKIEELWNYNINQKQ